MRRAITISACVCLAGGTALYALRVGKKSLDLYEHTKRAGRGWVGDVFRPDAELGFRPMENGRGAETFPVGPDIPVWHDIHGFRIPVRQGYLHKRPYVLGLGCSFMYGATCDAEDTFVWRVGEALGGRGLNAGCCGWGLTEMVLRGAGEIARWSPEYVLVQYSPWLVDRAVSAFAPTYYSVVPQPYWVDMRHGGGIRIERAPFMPLVLDLGPWRHTPRSRREFVRFLGAVGFPLYAHDDWGMMWCLGGAMRRATKDRRAVIRDSYLLLADACTDAGSTMIVVVLGHNGQAVSVPAEIDQVHVVHAQHAMIAALPRAGHRAWPAAYGMWRGNPPELIDNHPNERAHAVIADAVLGHIADI
jgi:hypothetical protein